MKKCCLNCAGFCWWDGDYCCTKNMEIHQYGYPNGYWMNEDIIKTMETPETCEDYEYAHHETYPESENIYIKEYNKLIEWIRLQDELAKFVNDKSGYYKFYKWYK